MKKVILFIAMSLDGYIADENGNIDWLMGDKSGENIDTYSNFVKGIDTILMGYNTYRKVLELSPNDWVYKDFKTFVITSRKLKSTEKIEFVNENPSNLVNKLKLCKGKNIWICGGASIVNQILVDDLIDEYHIAIIPTILGFGIKLFNTSSKEFRLKQKSILNYNGISELVYERFR